jgi:uncharacterized glyoxalase superfamily protein PhnB
MQLTGSVPVLGCNHIEETLDFYQQALQFIVVNQRGSDEGPEWVYLKSGKTLLMLEALQANKVHNPGGSRIYLYTNDASALHHFLNAKGYSTGELKTTDYGMQEFDIKDPEGHYLTIGQPLTEK